MSKKECRNSEWRLSIIGRIRDKHTDQSKKFKEVVLQNDRLRKEISGIKTAMNKQNELINKATKQSEIIRDPLKLNYDNVTLKDKLSQKEIGIQTLLKFYENCQQENLKLNEANNALTTFLKEKGLNVDKLTSKLYEANRKINELQNLNVFLEKNWEMSKKELDCYKEKLKIMDEKLRKSLNENCIVKDQLKFHKTQIDLENEEPFLLIDFENENGEIILENLSCSECEETFHSEYYSDLSSNFMSIFKDCYGTPDRAFLKFQAHDEDIQSVCWAPNGNIIATGGCDFKIKIWNISFGQPNLHKTLIGSCGSINSIQFNYLGSHVIGTSNDCAARIWRLGNESLEVTLTGHEKEVLTAKFLENSTTKVVSGSRDGSIKFWDTRNIYCFNTKFVNSTCHDIIVDEKHSNTIISGHFDKKIRFWDMRSQESFNWIETTERVTSLDMSKDGTNLLCLARDNTVNIFDTRNDKILKTLSNENFIVNCNWSKAGFNSYGNKIAAGCSNGIFIWNTDGVLEAQLTDDNKHKNQRNFEINAVNWHPMNTALASVGKSKICTIWTET